MKKSGIISGIAVVLLGIALIIGGFAMTDFDVSALADKVSETMGAQTEERTVDFESDAASIDIYARSGKISVKTGSKFSVTVKENKYFKYTIGENDGNLTVTGNPVKKAYGWFSWLSSGCGVEVTVPASRKVDLKVKAPQEYFWIGFKSSENADLTFENIDFKNMDISLTNGSFTLNRVSAEEVRFTGTNGKIQVSDSNVTKLSASTTNGSVKVERVTATDTVELKTTNGGVTLADTQSNKLTATTTNGVVKAERVTATDVLDLKTTNGDMTLTDAKSDNLTARTTNGVIKVERAVANYIRFESTNGAIKGTVAGRQADYTITANTTNGSNSLTAQEGNGGKELYVRTTNGDIDLIFI